jgi:AcrR family transcriptional regulator
MPSHPAAGLRDRLVDAGVALLSTEGTRALTLREIARHAGVSHGAPRRHFPTHVSLLSAVARRGFEELTVLVTEVLGAGGPARCQVHALGRVYLRFAVEHPGMFELMFRHDLLESECDNLRESSLPLFDTLVRLVAAVDTPARQPTLVAAALWTNLHGIAQLWSWGSLQLATDMTAFEPLLQAALDAHLGPATRSRSAD